VRGAAIEIGMKHRADGARQRPAFGADALPAVDRALHLRIDVVHAEARAIDPDRGKRIDHVARPAPRVDLDHELEALEARAAYTATRGEESFWRKLWSGFARAGIS
jgi:hypothetical protein